MLPFFAQDKLPHRLTARSRASARKVLASLGLALVASISAAQTTDPVLARAAALVAAQQPQQAYELLEPLESSQAGDAEFSYLLGIAALDAGHISRAIFALERSVELRPSSNLARAELGRAYLAAGEPAKAMVELRLARRGEMPAEAAAAIDRVMSLVEPGLPADRAGIWRGYLEALAGYDNNANSATAAGQFALPAFGGLSFQLTPENRQRSDSFAGYGGGVGLRLPLSVGWELDAAVNARASHYRRADTLDNRQVDASAGVAYTRGPSQFSGAVQVNTYDIDQQRFRRASGFSGQWQYTLDTQSQLSLFAQRSRLAYSQDAARDADRTVVGTGYARAFAGGRVAYASVYLARETARDGEALNYGHRATGMRVGAETAVTADSQAFAALQFESRRYGGTEPFFDAQRRDRQLDLTVGVHYVPASHWRVTPQFSFVRADSNVVLYDYRRVIWQIAVRREFK